MVQIQHLCCCKQIYKKHMCISFPSYKKIFEKKSVINGIRLQNVIITESINN